MQRDCSRSRSCLVSNESTLIPNNQRGPLKSPQHHHEWNSTMRQRNTTEMKSASVGSGASVPETTARVGKDKTLHRLKKDQTHSTSCRKTREKQLLERKEATYKSERKNCTRNISTAKTTRKQPTNKTATTSVKRHDSLPTPPWITPKKSTRRRRQPQQQQAEWNATPLPIHAVAQYVSQRQEEAWNDVWKELLSPLLRNLAETFNHSNNTRRNHNSTSPPPPPIQGVLKCLYHMGVVPSVLQCVVRVVLDIQTPISLASNDVDHASTYKAWDDLAHYLSHGITRVPTPGALSQRLAVLQVILTFRTYYYLLWLSSEYGTNNNNNNNNMTETELTTTRDELLMDQQTLDPVVLWHFLMQQDSREADATDTFDDEHVANMIQEFQWWLSSRSPAFFYLWIWELRGRVRQCLAEEEEERRLAHATADQLAHMVSMAAITVELGLNQSTQAVCHNMGQGCEWIKTKLGSPVKEGEYYIEMPLEEDEEQGMLMGNGNGSNIPIETRGEEEVDRISQVSDSSLSSAATSNAPSTAATIHSTQSRKSATSAKKTKQGIVHDTYTSYSSTARHATDTARQTTQSYVSHFRKVSGDALKETAASSRSWATQHVDSNPRHWAYLDASAKVALASLGALGVLGEAVLNNTQTLLDHTTTVTTDLVQHRFGPTAAHVFEDVSRTATNVWRTTAQVVALASPSVFATSVVKHTTKDRLRQQQVQEQTLRQQAQQQQQQQQQQHESQPQSEPSQMKTAPV